MFVIFIKIDFDNCRPGKGFSMLEASSSDKLIRIGTLLQYIKDEARSSSNLEKKKVVMCSHRTFHETSFQ